MVVVRSVGGSEALDGKHLSTLLAEDVIGKSDKRPSWWMMSTIYYRVGRID